MTYDVSRISPNDRDLRSFCLWHQIPPLRYKLFQVLISTIFFLLEMNFWGPYSGHKYFEVQNVWNDNKILYSPVIWLKFYHIQWGWGITGQRITGQSCPDWLKMTSSRTSKPNSGGLSRFWTIKICRKWSNKPVLPRYLSQICKIYILQFRDS